MGRRARTGADRARRVRLELVHPASKRLSIGNRAGQDDAARLGPRGSAARRAIAADPCSPRSPRRTRVNDVATYATTSRSPSQPRSRLGHGGKTRSASSIRCSRPGSSSRCARPSCSRRLEALAWTTSIPTPTELDSALASYASRQHAMLSAWFELVGLSLTMASGGADSVLAGLDAPKSGFLKRTCSTHRAPRRLAGSGAATDLAL